MSKNIFTKHPKEVGMNYFQHFVFAWTLIFNMIYAIFASIIHAFLPFLFVTTTSGIIKQLYNKTNQRKKT